MKYIPSINCGLAAGQSPYCWNGKPFDTEEECRKWIDEQTENENFTGNELAGGVFPLEINDEEANASYDVRITPTVNVKAHVKDPQHPTEKEIDEIVKRAIQSIWEEFNDVVSPDNTEFVKLYSVFRGGKETIIDSNTNTLEQRHISKIALLKNEYIEKIKGILREHNADELYWSDIDSESSPVLLSDEYNVGNTYTLDALDMNGVCGSSCCDNIDWSYENTPIEVLEDIYRKLSDFNDWKSITTAGLPKN